jgi:hypothetical protein
MLRLVTILFAALFAAVPAPAQQKPASAIKLSLPNTTWVLEIPAMGFAVQRETIRPDGHGRSLYAVDKARGLNLSVFLERVPRSASAKECREFYWQRLRNSPVKREDVRMSERGEMAILEYTVRDFTGSMPETMRKILGDFEQRHLNAYFSRGYACIDIHLSKMLKSGDKAPPFGVVLDSVRMVHAAPAGPIRSPLPPSRTSVNEHASYAKEYRHIPAPPGVAEIASLADHDLAATYLAVNYLAHFTAAAAHGKKKLPYASIALTFGGIRDKLEASNLQSRAKVYAGTLNALGQAIHQRRFANAAGSYVVQAGPGCTKSKLGRELADYFTSSVRGSIKVVQQGYVVEFQYRVAPPGQSEKDASVEAVVARNAVVVRSALGPDPDTGYFGQISRAHITLRINANRWARARLATPDIAADIKVAEACVITLSRNDARED